MDTKARVLIVDDEADIREFLSYNLTKNGFKVEVAEDGIEGLKRATSFSPHIIILDIMMPGMSGIELCKEIRSRPEFNGVLIAMLTARQEDQVQIESLNVGADDYITKPLKPSVFLSRIKALLRRTDINVSESLKFKDLVIDPVSFQITLHEKTLDLPKKEFEILYLLASKPGKVFGRDEILSKIWGREVIVGDRTIDVHIRKLREKIGDKYVQTIKGVGYKFVF
ncbi:MAG: response regulator transcription factor [Saprospiraceae bacterium]|nr:response regulator transcription factor [Saprospiraceae bacterium]